MNCAVSTLKFAVMVFNTLLALFGIGTIVVIALALETVYKDAKAACILLIISGSIIFLIAFSGCCGVINGSAVCMLSYVIFLIIIAIVNVIALCGFIERIDSDKLAHYTVDKAWNEYKNGNGKQMAYIQQDRHCCGRSGPSDYLKENKVIPASCYEKQSIVDKNLYKTGCYENTKKVYKSAQSWVKGFTWTTLIIEIGAIICGTIVALRFKTDSRDSF